MAQFEYVSILQQGHRIVWIQLPALDKCPKARRVCAHSTVQTGC